MAIYRKFHASHLSVICINFVIRREWSDNNISFLLAMLCHFGVLRLAPLTICLGFTRFLIPISFCQRKDNNHEILYVYHPLEYNYILGSYWQTMY